MVGLPRRALAVLGLAGALFLVGRATGSGWAVVLLCGLVALVAVGTVWPAAAVYRVEAEVTGHPGQTTAGAPVWLRLRVAGARSGVRARVVVDGVAGGWVAVIGEGEGQAEAVAPRRGVVREVGLDVESAAPVGLVPCRRRLVLALPFDLEVGPRPDDVAAAEVPEIGQAVEAAAAGTRVGAETLRGVRPYAAGDAVRLVHWPATAHWSALMVRELEDPTSPRLVVVVDLRGRQERVEPAASYAAGVVRAAVRAGCEVELLTAEAGGPAAGAVAGPADIVHRLARATTGAPAEPRPGSGQVVRVRAR